MMGVIRKNHLVVGIVLPRKAETSYREGEVLKKREARRDMKDGIRQEKAKSPEAQIGREGLSVQGDHRSIEEG